MDAFEAHRPHLHAVATRILGSRAEADDALQEAWLRINRADTSDVDNIGGWLTTVVSRVCLTMLDQRKRRREEALEAGRLPDPVITRGDFAELLALLDPDVVLRSDDGGSALRVIEGAQAVATNARLFGATRVAHPAIVDGAAGFVATEAGLPVAVLAFTIHDGRITAIEALGDQARLGELGLEAFVAN